VTKVKDNTRKHYELHAVLIKELFWPISTRSSVRLHELGCIGLFHCTECVSVHV